MTLVQYDACKELIDIGGYRLNIRSTGAGCADRVPQQRSRRSQDDTFMSLGTESIADTPLRLDVPAGIRRADVYEARDPDALAGRSRRRRPLWTVHCRWAVIELVIEVHPAACSVGSIDNA
jgi:hypothetical protein